MKVSDYIPIVGWLPKYDWNHFITDVVAGVTLATLVVPQAMGYASKA